MCTCVSSLHARQQVYSCFQININSFTKGYYNERCSVREALRAPPLHCWTVLLLTLRCQCGTCSTCALAAALCSYACCKYTCWLFCLFLSAVHSWRVSYCIACIIARCYAGLFLFTNLYCWRAPNRALPHLLWLIVGLELWRYSDEHKSNEELLFFSRVLRCCAQCLVFLSALNEWSC